MFLNTLRFLLGLSVLAAACASAAVVDITAEFKPQPGQAMPRSFTNTTPLSGVCARSPESCRRAGVASVALPISFRSSYAAHSTAGISLPRGPQTVTIRHEDGASTERLQVELNGLGGTLLYYASVAESTPRTPANMAADWGGSWEVAPSGCTAVVSRSRSPYFDFMWKTAGSSRCMKTAGDKVRRTDISDTQLSYVLTTPNPLGMKPGVYTGSITYFVGSFKDIDMGHALIPSDGALTLRFRLFVDALLKVEIPPGGHRVELVPPEGWAHWTDHGRVPSRLARDQTFRIWANGSFNMRVECQNVQADTCALRRADGSDTVGLDVYVSLPGQVTDSAGRTVTRKRLTLDSHDPLTVARGRYIDGKAGVLTFEIPGKRVGELLKKVESGPSGERTSYSGLVTVIWESVI